MVERAIFKKTLILIIIITILIAISGNAPTLVKICLFIFWVYLVSKNTGFNIIGLVLLPILLVSFIGFKEGFMDPRCQCTPGIAVNPLCRSACGAIKT